MEENILPEKKEVILTDSQKARIIEILASTGDRPPKIKDIIKDPQVFNREIDAREMEGLAVRKFITESGFQFHKAREWIPTKIISLTEEQKLFIGNNVSNMKPLEMARILFKNEELTNLDVETRTIQKYIKELPVELSLLPKLEEINIEDYQPPKTESQTLKKINKYVTSAEYDENKISEKQKKEIRKLMKYLHIHRFISEINKYESVAERDLFESEYIRGTFNKADLTQEQLDQYIMYSGLVVNGTRIDATKKRLERIEQSCLEERSTVPQALADRINDLSGRYDQCIDAQNKILKSLEGERKERLKNNSQVKETVADVLAYWKNEEKRRHFLKMALERRAKVKEEVDRIKNMSEIRAEMFGINESEILE